MDLKNTSVAYDQNGITITIFTNKHFFYSWDDVISVQDTYADPRLFKGATDLNQRRILKIGVRNHKGKMSVHKVGNCNSVLIIYNACVFIIQASK